MRLNEICSHQRKFSIRIESISALRHFSSEVFRVGAIMVHDFPTGSATDPEKQLFSRCDMGSRSYKKTDGLIP
jgi:hypothetical protein